MAYNFASFLSALHAFLFALLQIAIHNKITKKIWKCSAFGFGRCNRKLFFFKIKSTNFWWHRDNVHRSLHIGRCKITFSTLMSRHHKIKRTESYFMHIVTTCSFACMNPIKRLNRSGNRCACGFLHSKYLMQIWGFFRCHPISLQSVFHVLSMCVNWKNYAL